MVRKCLCEADIKGGNTIAFPLFGTGGLRYPIPETAAAMLEAIGEYRWQAIGSCLQKVTIVAQSSMLQVCISKCIL